MHDKAQAFWDSHAEKYDDTEKQFEPIYVNVIAKTMELIGPADRVLDYGCASGYKAMEFAKVAGHVHGLDFSAKMIGQAMKKQGEAAVSNLSFSQGTIFSNEFEPGSFDMVIAYSILHLLKEDKAAVRRIHELLKPGGYFVSTIACYKNRMPLKNRLIFMSYFIKYQFGMFPLYLNWYSTKGVERMLQNQGFQIIISERLFHGMTVSFIIARK